MSTQSLLQNPPPSEYPTEFLVARLQGKKSRLFQNWEKLLSRTDLKELLKSTHLFTYLSEYGNAGVWRHLNHEHQWVYVRMNPSLRKRFAPYFIFRQTETLLASLRYLHKTGSLDEANEHIHDSLLNKGLQEVLMSGRPFTEIVEDLEIQLVAVSKKFAGLSNQYMDEGYQSMEIFLMDGLLAYISSLQADQTLAAFFQSITDYHNSLILAKALHWKQKKMPRFYTDGSHAVERFERAFSRNDLQSICKIFRLDIFPDIQSPVSILETAILKNITTTLKTWSRLRSATAYILYYLWEQFRYTRNISMLLHTTMLDDELVSEQIII